MTHSKQVRPDQGLSFSGNAETAWNPAIGVIVFLKKEFNTRTLFNYKLKGSLAENSVYDTIEEFIGANRCRS